MRLFMSSLCPDDSDFAEAIQVVLGANLWGEKVVPGSGYRR